MHHQIVNLTIFIDDCIEKFTSDGVLLTKWGTSGSGDGQFDNPEGIAVDSAEDVYVADTVNDRIQKFDKDGAYISQFGSPGGGDGQFNGPYGVALDKEGNIYTYIINVLKSMCIKVYFWRENLDETLNSQDLLKWHYNMIFETLLNKIPWNNFQGKYGECEIICQITQTVFQ